MTVKQAFEARQKRRIAATNSALHHHKRKKLRKLSEEELYQDRKENWFFHESSWYMRHDNGYDGYGCNEGGCVPECRYYRDHITMPKKKKE